MDANFLAFPNIGACISMNVAEGLGKLKDNIPLIPFHMCVSEEAMKDLYNNCLQSQIKLMRNAIKLYNCLPEYDNYFSNISDLISSTLTSIVGRVPYCKIGRVFYPENWTAREVYDADKFADWFNVLVLDEGIPMYCSMRSDVVHKLLSSESRQERRKIIWSNRRSIAKYCIAKLQELSATNSHLNQLRDLLIECWCCARDGYYKPAQSMAVSVVETCLSRYEKKIKDDGFTGKRHLEFKERNFGNSSIVTIQRDLVIGCLWSSYDNYYPDREFGVPVKLNRHASAHYVCNRQYTKINCLLSLMQATSLLVYECDRRV